MAEKKIKKLGRTKKQPEPTVQHESSADSAQDIGTNNLVEERVRNSERSSHRRGHNGSDGSSQDRGSNH